MARPITWTEEKKKEAIRLIFEGIYGGKSVRSILDKGDRAILPSFVTFNEWLDQDDKLAKQYVRMCEARADKIFEEIIQIADDTGDDLIKLNDGREVVNHSVINRDKLRVDARKWALSKMNPKKYGDKLDLNTTEKSKIEYMNVSKQYPNET